MTFIDNIKDMFKKKQKLVAIFFDETGSTYAREVVYSNNRFEVSDKLFGHKGVYIVDHNFIIYDRRTRKPYCYYYTNNPNPIHIHHERNKDVDSIGFKRILDSKVITELFSTDGLKFLTVILIIVIIVGLLSLAIGYGVFKVNEAVSTLQNVTVTLCG
jgi:hypothetical protein